MKSLSILGIRGIPAAHGGFETFAEFLALYLQSRGWKVTVYCQEESGSYRESEWQGIRLIHIPVTTRGALGTIEFDFRTVLHSLKGSDLLLTLGYNTALFNLLHYVAGRNNIINMDGIEWRRDKWGVIAKTWFWLNERFGCWFGTHLVADHPRIADHLASRVSRSKITMIPYGGRHIVDADVAILDRYNLKPQQYMIVIARAEPENSLYEIVSGFVQRPRNIKLVVLGHYDPLTNPFHARVMSIANSDVIFPGAIYAAEDISALRYYALAYIHGHRVGGTNPSLVEALGAGNAIIAHDNHFNRWVAGDGAIYFSDTSSCDLRITELTSSQDLVHKLQREAQTIFSQRFTWGKILAEYEIMLERYLE